MKKNKNYWLKMLLLLIIPLSSVYADEIILDCPSEIEAYSEFTCEITGVALDGITSLKANMKLSDDLSFVSFVVDKKWQGDGTAQKITLYSDRVIEDQDFKIGTLKLKNNGGSRNNIVLDAVLFGDRNDGLKSVDAKSISMTLKNTSNNSTNNSGNSTVNDGKDKNNSENNNNSNDTVNNTNDNSNSEIVNSFYLKDIKIDGYKLDFAKSKFEYDLKIGNEDKLKITPVLEDKEASYEIIGNDKIDTGSIIKIRITSREGLIQDYIIRIEKNSLVQEDKKDNNYTFIFIIIIVVLVGINIMRLVLKRKNR